MMKPYWNPEKRIRPTSALYEVDQALRIVRQNQGLPIDRRARDELEADAWLCMTTMLAGHGSYETWGVIVKNLNMAMILTEMGYGAEWAPYIRLAMDGAYRSKQRADRTGRWGLDGQAAAAIREALQVHTAQLERASKADLGEAMRQMYDRLATGNVYMDAEAA